MSEEMDMSPIPIGSKWVCRWGENKDKEFILTEKSGPFPHEPFPGNPPEFYKVKGQIEGVEVELTDELLMNDWKCLDTGLTYTKLFHVGDNEMWSDKMHEVYAGLLYALTERQDISFEGDGWGHRRLIVKGDLNKFRCLVALIINSLPIYP